MKWFSSLILAAISLSMAEAEELANEAEIASFLEEIASAGIDSWDRTIENVKAKFPQWPKGTVSEKLNYLSPFILEQDNLQLIHLLRRALRNHDRLSEEKARPLPFFYRHYQPPSFLIPEIEIVLDVQAEKVLVATRLFIERQDVSESLVLDGRNQKVLSVFVNENPWPKEFYKVTQDELILLNVPTDKTFAVTVTSEIDPFHNHTLEGLYATGKFLTSQCESEGARKIFFTLDRPDVLSKIKTTIVADRKRYPHRLSNGNLVGETEFPDGRVAITWEDPIPKPSYLFACILGDFSRLEDRFTTKSGRDVVLEVYVEPGKEARAVYSLTVLKKAMEFDETFFDREYDLDYLKMVAVPDLNFGAMENKGLLVFNDACLLADSHSGTDADFRWIALVVAHEYFHNWSGNRVTIRNWFEIALKEAFTDFRAALFGEWLFGSEFIRPKDVMLLREAQFPEETSGEGHPLIVESYVVPSSLYDHTTYIKGREVFRSLQTCLDMLVPDGFRKAQNLYFSKYDGQAVTFRELLCAANEVLVQHTGKNLSQFERWFDQQGTPQVQAEICYLPPTLELTISQSCLHPETGEEQEPFLIPFSYEFLRKDGTLAHPKENFILSEKSHSFQLAADEELIPIFMHGYSAPVILHYDYSKEDLACLMNHARDPFSRWEAGENYSLLAIREVQNEALFNPYIEALQSKALTPLAKAALLRIPSIRAISQKFQDYDFPRIQVARASFAKELAKRCKPCLEQLLLEHPEPPIYSPTPEQMQIRELRHACLNLLAHIDPGFADVLHKQALYADNFDASFAAFKMLAHLDAPESADAILELHDRWHEDKILFNHWLRAQASSSRCTVSDLKRLMSTKGFDAKNPNHIRSVLSAFLHNLGQYHDPKGEGYEFIVDQILEITPFNPIVAHKNIATPAFIDFEMIPKEQKKLMIREMKRLLVSPAALPETRDLIQKMIGG